MMKLLLLLALIAGALCVQFEPATFSEGNFTIRLFPAGTVDPSEHCFSSSVTGDQNSHFYFEEIYASNYWVSPCEFADSLIRNQEGIPKQKN
jgi:hypothetical protein